MKLLVIVRHAKAVPFGYEEDFNRELTDRGERDADKISNRLSEMKIVPGLMISSPAMRAIQTCTIFARNLNYPESHIIKNRRLYMEFTRSEFVEYIQALPDSASTVFVFGHNPSFSFFVANLLQTFSGDMPTCSTVGIRFNIDKWSDLRTREGKLDFHLIPRLL